MTALWEGKGHCLNHEGAWVPLKEIWDGSRLGKFLGSGSLIASGFCLQDADFAHPFYVQKR